MWAAFFVFRQLLCSLRIDQRTITTGIARPIIVIIGATSYTLP